EVAREIAARDKQDSERSVAPLKPAADAAVIDTTGLSIDEAVDTIIGRMTRQQEEK
ncbi:MAG TPA: cytidylate kinase, partial [Lentisphaeria bacterium]|nr:cytidylate kinase [Lentisphaeria bacterium]